MLRLAEGRPKGPSPTFQRAHIFLAFLTIGNDGTIGRQALADRSGLGDGAIRTVLKKLREGGYADANASGSHLTRDGQKVYAKLMTQLSTVAPLEDTNLTMGSAQAALCVRNAGKGVGSGIEQRDSAIGLGAKGATTYVIKGGKFTVPGGSSDCEKDFPSEAWEVIRAELKPQNGDAVILCGAETTTLATLGALAAVLTLV
jgi:hypothetical protein